MTLQKGFLFMHSTKKRTKKNPSFPSFPIKVFFACLFLALFLAIFSVARQRSQYIQAPDTTSESYQSLAIEENFLTVNEYSRPQTALKKVNNIVIHYTRNPGSDAEGNRNYFESLKDSHITHASSHFIVGLDGTIVQCIPLTEIAYASNDRNIDTVSIECCHPKENGKFTKETYESLLRLCAYLCQAYNLSSKDLIRHYDVTEKICPKYYVEHPKKWEKLKNDVQKLLK